jgi:hypothetical protein
MTSTAVVADPAVACWPTVSPTELTTPVRGLTIVAWLSCCCASARLALAASTADWSAASWAALTATVVEPVPPVVAVVLAAVAVPAEVVPVGVFAAEVVPVAAFPAEVVPVEEAPAEVVPVEAAALVMSLSSAVS